MYDDGLADDGIWTAKGYQTVNQRKMCGTVPACLEISEISGMSGR